jgi:hypothetical protein
MRTMLIAGATLLSLSASVAYAGEGEGPAANTFFTELPGVVAQADVPNAPTYAQNGQTQTKQAQNGQAQSGQTVQTYVTHSSHGTWLFAPDPNAGANS